MSFAPFIDPGRIDEARARKAHGLAVRANHAYKMFIADPTPETYAIYLDVQDDFNGICMETAAQSVVTPLMIHIASAPGWEDDERAPEGRAYRQRCVKCGSELLAHVPGATVTQTAEGVRPTILEDFGWYPPGERVGKVVSPDEEIGASMLITPTDRDLEPYEHPCVGGSLTTIEDIPHA